MLLKSQGIPLASLRREKIATVDMDGARKPIDRIDDGMNDVSAQRFSVHCAKGLCTGGLDLVGASFHPPPKHIVLPARINADDGPHSMIVRHDHHSGCPDDIDDGERIRMKKLPNSGALRFPQPFEDCCWIRNSAGEYFTNCFVCRILCKRLAAISNKPLRIEHEHLHRTEKGEERT